MASEFCRYSVSVTDGDDLRFVGGFCGLQRGCYSTVRGIGGNKNLVEERIELNEGDLRLFMGEFNEWVYDYDVFYRAVVYLKVNLVKRERPVVVNFDADEVWYHHRDRSVIFVGVDSYFSEVFFRLLEDRQGGEDNIIGKWRSLSCEEKMKWLRVNLYYHDWATVDKKNQVLEIDGSDVLDEIDFCCAIGEAVNGPGGYFGQSLDGVEDCFFAGFGIETPVTLIWHNFETSKRVWFERGLEAKLTTLFDIFECRGVKTVLC